MRKLIVILSILVVLTGLWGGIESILLLIDLRKEAGVSDQPFVTILSGISILSISLVFIITGIKSALKENKDYADGVLACVSMLCFAPINFAWDSIDPMKATVGPVSGVVPVAAAIGIYFVARRIILPRYQSLNTKPNK